MIFIRLIRFRMSRHEHTVEKMLPTWLLPVVPCIVITSVGAIVASTLPKEHAIITIFVRSFHEIDANFIEGFIFHLGYWNLRVFLDHGYLFTAFICIFLRFLKPPPPPLPNYSSSSLSDTNFLRLLVCAPRAWCEGDIKCIFTVGTIGIGMFWVGTFSICEPRAPGGSRGSALCPNNLLWKYFGGIFNVELCSMVVGIGTRFCWTQY